MTKRFLSNISAPSIIKTGGTSTQYLMADGSVSTGSTTASLNYSQTQATKQTNITASGVTIVSASITTGGNPVEVIVTGDAENTAASGWIKLQLFRGSTAIGKIIHVESSAASENIPYALTVIDTPTAGTYTYSLQTVSIAATGAFNFGETDGPVLTAKELNTILPTSTLSLNGSAPQISLTNATNNIIKFASNGVAAPTFTTYSAGTKIVLYDNITGSATGHAIGIETGNNWYGSNGGHKFYAGITNTATIDSSGNLTAGSFIKSGGTSSQYLMADGSVTTSSGGGGTTTNALTLGSGLTGTSFNGSAAITTTVNSSVIPYLANANTFTTTQTITPATSVTGLAINAAASSKGIIVKNNATTPGSPLEIQDSSGNPLINIDSSGGFTITAGGTNTSINGQYGGLTVRSNTTAFALNSSAHINTGYSGGIGLIVRGSPSQSADLQQWQTSNPTNVAKVDANGNATFASIIKTGGTSSQYLMADGSTLAGVVLPDIIPLDDIQNQFNGGQSRFVPRYQGIQQTITNPLRLLLTINGIIQRVSFPEYVWGSFFSRDGFMVDSDGYLAFSEPVPSGSTFDARIMAGPTANSSTTIYPFKATDILLGAY